MWEMVFWSPAMCAHGGGWRLKRRKEKKLNSLNRKNSTERFSILFLSSVPLVTFGEENKTQTRTKSFGNGNFKGEVNA
jgi:hypothetical protein